MFRILPEKDPCRQSLCLEYSLILSSSIRSSSSACIQWRRWWWRISWRFTRTKLSERQQKWHTRWARPVYICVYSSPLYQIVQASLNWSLIVSLCLSVCMVWFVLFVISWWILMELCNWTAVDWSNTMSFTNILNVHTKGRKTCPWVCCSAGSSLHTCLTCSWRSAGLTKCSSPTNLEVSTEQNIWNMSKRVIGCKINFSSCFNINGSWKCVYTHPVMIKIHPGFFFFESLFQRDLFSVLRFLSEWRSSVQAAPTIVDWQDRLILDPPWVSCKQFDRHCVDSGAEEDKMSPIKRLRRFIFGCNNEYSSCHLFPTSELLKTQKINVTLSLKGMLWSLICLNVSIFTRIIRDPASSAEEVSRVFMNLCTSPFLITC